MKDATHHLKYLQKKVIQENRRNSTLGTSEKSVEQPLEYGGKKISEKDRVGKEPPLKR